MTFVFASLLKHRAGLNFHMVTPITSQNFFCFYVYVRGDRCLLLLVPVPLGIPENSWWLEYPRVLHRAAWWPQHKFPGIASLS